MYELNSTSVWGPVGGGVIAPLGPFFRLGLWFGIVEWLRTLMTIAGRRRIGVRKALDRYTEVIFANTDTARFLTEDDRPEKVELETGIKNIDPKGEQRSYQLCDAPKVRLLFVGSLIPRKGLHLLLDVMAEMEDRYSLTVVGTGGLEQKMKSFVRDRNLTSRVMFSGFVPRSNLPSIYATHDIFVFPSLRDTSGNVVLEAMSCGVPVIAFDHHGMKDVIGDEDGIKIHVGSYDQMVGDFRKAIMQLAGDDKLRERL